MKHEKIKLKIIGLLGVLGYIFCLLQWIWSIMLFLPAILNSSLIKSLTYTPPPQPIVQHSGEVSTVAIVFIVAIAVIMTLVTIYILVKLPATIGKIGSKVTHSAADLTLPIITKHKQLPTKKRIIITARLLFAIKIALCVVPFILMVFADPSTIDLPSGVAAVAGSILAFCSISLFCIQITSARLLKIDYRKAW